jgi:hypothetical protein
VGQPNGFIKQGGTYRVYANATDTSGVASATADVSTITTSGTAVALAACSVNCTVGGTTYTLVSAEQTAKTPLSEGSKGYSVTATDNAGNSGTNSTFSVTADNTGPSVTMNNPGSPLSGASVSLTATSADTGGSGVQSVAIQEKLSSQSTWTTVCTDTTSPYSCTLNSTTVPDGSYDFQAVATDNLGNTATSTPVTQRVVSNSAPTATGFLATDHGGTAGVIQTTDAATLTFSEEMSTTSILSTWTNAATSQNVTVRFINGTTDTMQVWNAANTAQLPLGTVDLKQDYVPVAGATFASTMVGTVQSDGSFDVAITLGTKTGTVNASAPGKSKAVWTPSPPTGATDLAGTAMTTTAFTGLNLNQF